MTQNTSSAVMAQRREPPDSLDFFPTPPWATRALVRNLFDLGIADWSDDVWDPACGDGAMVFPLRESFSRVRGSDCHDYDADFEVLDFLRPMATQKFDWIITNPPFRLAEQFAHKAFTRVWKGVALLVRSTFLEGVGRYETLFAPYPPAYVMPFAERVPIIKGRLCQQASSATAYSWLVWKKRPHSTETKVRWIAPCRKRLEKPSDYDDV